MNVIRLEGGKNLQGWIVNVGDGNYVYPGESPVNDNDIKTVDKEEASVLKANVKNRRIMAHNITFKRITDPNALVDVQVADYKFKIPYVISASNTDFNGQTIEGGLFVWDGAGTQLDYGLAFQWVINPFDFNFKKLYYWDGVGWRYLSVDLEPDTEFHFAEFYLDIPNKQAFLKIDDISFPINIYSETTKQGFGNTVDARFQAEIISIFPPSTGTVPLHETRFEKWKWEWRNSDIV